MEYYEISKLLNNSTASKFVTKMDRIDWLIRRSIFSKQKYKV